MVVKIAAFKETIVDGRVDHGRILVAEDLPVVTYGTGLGGITIVPRGSERIPKPHIPNLSFDPDVVPVGRTVLKVFGLEVPFYRSYRIIEA